MKSGRYLGAALLLAAGVCQAKNYAIVYTDGIHSLQDAAQESVWAKANALTDFSFPWKKAPAPKTEFRALWTPENDRNQDQHDSRDPKQGPSLMPVMF